MNAILEAVPRGTFHPVQPGVIIAAKNPVAMDAVAKAVMGFDPTSEPPVPPFLCSANYLNMAHQLRLGTNRLEEIQVVPSSIADVPHEFESGREPTSGLGETQSTPITQERSVSC